MVAETSKSLCRCRGLAAPPGCRCDSRGVAVMGTRLCIESSESHLTCIDQLKQAFKPAESQTTLLHILHETGQVIKLS